MPQIPLTPKLAEQLAGLPNKPGVYQYRDRYNALLYVGKAKNLKNRVSSYFQANAMHSPRIHTMVRQIADIQLIITRTDLEALILEANLIKTHRPRYNILMQDDKKYPWLVLTPEPFPRLEFRREPDKRPKAKSFGPYPSASALYETLKLVRKIFPMRQRKKPLFKDRPCMNYHIGQCLGPCQGLVDETQYTEMVRQLERFLRGQADTLLKPLEAQMKAASEALDFEQAALLRDRLEAIQSLLVRQPVMTPDARVFQDAIGVVEADGVAYFAVLQIRKGKLIQTHYAEMALNSDPVESLTRVF